MVFSLIRRLVYDLIFLLILGQLDRTNTLLFFNVISIDGDEFRNVRGYFKRFSELGLTLMKVLSRPYIVVVQRPNLK